MLCDVVQCPEASRHFSTNQLPSLIQVLLSFRKTAPPQVRIIDCGFSVDQSDG